MPNAEIIRRAVEWAEAEAQRPRGDKEWEQEHYGSRVLRDGVVCGTTGCVAWHICTVEPGVTVNYARPHRTTGAARVPTTVVTMLDGRYLSIHDAAAEIAELGPLAAATLFAGSNDVEDLWNYASQITDGEVEVPAHVKKWNEDDVDWDGREW